MLYSIYFEASRLAVVLVLCYTEYNSLPANGVCTCHQTAEQCWLAADIAVPAESLMPSFINNDYS